MSVLGQLLAAQARPEAARITEAIAGGIEEGGADAADRAYRRELSRIAAERCPRPQCPAAVVGFGDVPPDPLADFADAEPAGVNLRLDRRFLLTATPPAAEPEPATDAVVVAVIVGAMAAAAVMALVLVVVALAAWVA